MLGKVQIIKTFVTSMFLYTTSAIVLPEKHLKEINKLITDFIWNGRKCKMKLSVLCRSKESGGLNVPDLGNMIRASNVKWMKKFLRHSNEDYWALIFKLVLNKYNISIEHLIRADFCLNRIKN